MNRGFIAEAGMDVRYFQNLSDIPDAIGGLIANTPTGVKRTVFISQVADDEGNPGQLVERMDITGVKL